MSKVRSFTMATQNCNFIISFFNCLSVLTFYTADYCSGLLVLFIQLSEMRKHNLALLFLNH